LLDIPRHRKCGTRISPKNTGLHGKTNLENSKNEVRRGKPRDIHHPAKTGFFYSALRMTALYNNNPLQMAVAKKILMDREGESYPIRPSGLRLSYEGAILLALGRGKEYYCFL
jgi:hypothetical protein